MAEMSGTIKMIILASVALIGMAAAVLVGGAVIEQYAVQLKDPTPAGENITLLNDTAVVLTNNYVISIQNVTNGTYQLIENVNYTVLNYNKVGLGYIKLTGTVAGTYGGNNTQVNYTYGAATSESGYADNFSTGITVFATFMGVIAIALVGKSIVELYKGV